MHQVPGLARCHLVQDDSRFPGVGLCVLDAGMRDEAEALMASSDDDD